MVVMIAALFGMQVTLLPRHILEFGIGLILWLAVYSTVALRAATAGWRRRRRDAPESH
jgi:Mg2+ and Co2+ transporter CorA